ncbi:MAG: DUF488 domain-containing protein [Bacillota bacterium]
MEGIVYTIGYEGQTTEGFIEKLHTNSIQTIIDVRQKPVSRKKGFSGKTLEHILSKNDIKYISCKELGVPKNIREVIQKEKNLLTFTNEYERILETKIDIVKDLINHIYKERCCLLCFEKKYSECHRSILAWNIKQIDGNGMRIKHL